MWKPSLEVNHVDEWELSWQMIFTRALLIYLSPLFFHVLDLAVNQSVLILSYKDLSNKIILLWSSLSFGLFYLIYFLVIGASTPTEDIPTNDIIDTGILDNKRQDFIYNNIFIFILSNCFAVIILYLLIFRKMGIFRRTTRRSNSNSHVPISWILIINHDDDHNEVILYHNIIMFLRVYWLHLFLFWRLWCWWEESCRSDSCFRERNSVLEVRRTSTASVQQSHVLNHHLQDSLALREQLLGRLILQEDTL